MRRNHNKKRNVGIIYELLIHHMTKCLLSGDRNEANVVKNIIEKRFRKGTELYKEYRIFNGLFKTQIKKTEIAASLISESKKFIQKIDHEKLEKEKSYLIRDINYNLPKNFYYSKLSDYKTLGNIQMMINEWKLGDNSDIANLVSLEEKVINHLVKRKKVIKEDSSSNQEVDNLIVDIMTKKINNKYSNLSEGQKNIIKNYALYKENNQKALVKYLKDIKANTLARIKIFENTNENQIIKDKINEVKNNISSLQIKNIDDEKIVKILTMTSLLEELKSEE